MFGKRCSLCGGKLNSYNICTECGLDNSKSDKNYNLSKKTSDIGELTHEHTGKETHSWERKTVQKQSRHVRPDPYQAQPKKKPAKSNGNLVAWLIRHAVILAILISALGSMFE